MNRLIFVDCEGGGSPAPGLERPFTEIGAVHYKSRQTFHGDMRGGCSEGDRKAVFNKFAAWLDQMTGDERPVFVSDNVAYDWQFINHGFHKYLGYNPFGHSGRRIGDFYAGLCGDFRQTQLWKRWRKTPHDHNPVNDAMGNVEAFEKILTLRSPSPGWLAVGRVEEILLNLLGRIALSADIDALKHQDLKTGNHKCWLCVVEKEIDKAVEGLK
jgi:hypothetical protein